MNFQEILDKYSLEAKQKTLKFPVERYCQKWQIFKAEWQAGTQKRVPKMARGWAFLLQFLLQWQSERAKVVWPWEDRFLGDLVAFQYLKKASKKQGEHHFNQADRDKTKGNSFILKDKRFRLDVRKKIYLVGAEILEKIFQRSYGCHIPWSVHGQAGWHFEKPDLVEGIPAYGGGGGWKWMIFKIPSNSRHSMILWSL